MTQEIIPNIPLNYQSFITSNNEKELIFSSNYIFGAPSKRESNFKITFLPNTLVDNSNNRVPFSTIQLDGTLLVSFIGEINDLSLNISFSIQPDYFFIHKLVDILNDNILNALTDTNIIEKLKISYTKDKLNFQNINEWNVNDTLQINIDYTNSIDFEHFIVFPKEPHITYNRAENNISAEISRSTGSFIPILMQRYIDKDFNFLYNIYNLTSYELHYIYGLSLQFILDNLIFSHEEQPINAMKYYVMSGGYTVEDFKNLNLVKFNENHNTSFTGFFPYDFYTYGYKGVIVNGPQLAHESMTLPYYTPNDLLYSNSNVALYSVKNIIIGFREDIRSLYQDFVKYGTFTSQEINETSQELNEIYQIRAQDICDDLGPNNINLLDKLATYYGGRVSVADMKYYLFSAFYSIFEIVEDTTYINSSGVTSNFDVADFYTYAYSLPERYFTPDVIRNSLLFTMEQIINQSGFSLQDLYDYKFLSYELKEYKTNLTIQQLINEINYNKSENDEDSIVEMKYYVFSAGYSVEDIKNAYYNNINTVFTTNDFYIYGYIGDTPPQKTGLPYYTPDQLRPYYELNEIIIDSEFPLQVLYDYNFIAQELNLDGEVPLQRVLDEITFNKTGDSISEMKYYIFDGSYNMQEIFDARYNLDSIITAFTPTDYSIYGLQYVASRYEPKDLRDFYSVSDIIDALTIYNGLYTIQHLYDNEFSAYEFNTIGSIFLQYLINNISYTKNALLNEVEEMKYYVFDGSYNIQEIVNSYYYQPDDTTNQQQFTALDFSNYGLQFIHGNPRPETNIYPSNYPFPNPNPGYSPSDLRNFYSVSSIVNGLNIFNGKYTLNHLYRNGFTGNEFNTNNIELQYILDNTTFNRVDNIDPIKEMKQFVFASLFTIVEIYNARYIDVLNSNILTAFTIEDFSIYGDLNFYSITELLEYYDYARFFLQYNNGNYTLQNLYDANFTSRLMNVGGNIPLQTIINDIEFNKNTYSDPIEEMKYFIFDAGFSVQEISQSYYNSNIYFSVEDFSIYGYNANESSWKYNAIELINNYSAAQIVNNVTVDSNNPTTNLYTLQHFKDMYDQYNNNSVFSVNNIKLNSNVIALQQPHLYLTIGYTILDLHTSFRVDEMLEHPDIGTIDLIRNDNKDSNPDSGYTISQLYYDSNNQIKISGDTVDSSLKHYYSIYHIIDSLGLKPLMNEMGIFNSNDEGNITIPEISGIQNEFTIIHQRNSIKRGLMELRLNASIYSNIYIDEEGNVTDSFTFTYYFPPLQLKELFNYTYDELTREGSYQSAELELSRRTPEELFNAGVVLNPALLEIFTDESALKSGGYTDAAISAAKAKDITSKDLIGLGFDVCELNTFTDVKRTWDRFENPTLENVTSEYRDALQMRRKAEVLKYNQNAIQNTPKQQLTNILKGRPSICTRGVTFASNKQNSSNSNVNNLNRVNNTLIYPVQTNAPRSLPPGNSGVPGNKPLVLDKSIPLFQFQKRYTYSTS